MTTASCGAIERLYRGYHHSRHHIPRLAPERHEMQIHTHGVWPFSMRMAPFASGWVQRPPPDAEREKDTNTGRTSCRQYSGETSQTGSESDTDSESNEVGGMPLLQSVSTQLQPLLGEALSRSSASYVPGLPHNRLIRKTRRVSTRMSGNHSTMYTVGRDVRG